MLRSHVNAIFFGWSNFLEQRYFFPAWVRPFSVCRMCLPQNFRLTFKVLGGRAVSEIYCTLWELLISACQVRTSLQFRHKVEPAGGISCSRKPVVSQVLTGIICQKIVPYSPAWNILFVSSIVAFLCPVGKQSLSSFQAHAIFYSPGSKTICLCRQIYQCILAFICGKNTWFT